MFRNLLVSCTLLTAAFAGLGDSAAGQVSARSGSRPWLVAFETPHGDVRLRLEGGLPYGSALLAHALVSSSGTRLGLSTQLVQLDETGAWSEDLEPERALALDGVELQALVPLTTAAGPGPRTRAANALVVASAAMLGTSGQRGDVIVTEFMKDPSFVSDSDGEWVELTNVAGQPRQIAGWMLHDGGSNSHVIQAQGPFLILLSNQRYVLGNEDDTTLNGGVPVQYQYSSFTLANGADDIFLTARNGDLVDAVSYDDGVSWPDTAGRSISVTPSAEDALSNDLASAWCHSMPALSASNPDTGTPGAVNDVCP